MSLEENAAKYFDEAKKAKKKREGALKTVEEFEKKQVLFEKKQQEDLVVLKAKNVEKSRKKFWFEKFKWFISSEGFLVIAGKDAQTNEDVIKRYTEDNDLVFHTDSPGSSFVVIKTKGLSVGDKTLNEAAIFTGVNSKIWQAGYRSADVFMVSPSQVTKEAKAGEYLSKGSFMIYGKRTNFSVTLDLGVGLIDYEGERLVCVGPLDAIKSNCEEFVVLKQGTEKKGEISKKLMKSLGLHTNDVLLSQLPGGTFSIVKVK